ncbi:MAG TPA: YafY family protein, partial [Chryseolinea sp.]|nr:YafY family protein [Chryseolinea sp.]
RFEMSLRTVYRDVKALMEAGVPIGSEAGKGYFIVAGYHLPPVMFTQDEANAMLLAGKLVEKMTDKSIENAFESALLKIKAVLTDVGKDNLEDLYSHIEVRRLPQDAQVSPNNFLTDIQRAVVNKEVISVDYFSNNDELTKRDVEPIGLFFYGGAWHLIAWCRLRNGYRDFRTDRIQTLVAKGERFDARNLLSLQEYLATVVQGNREVEKVAVLFDSSIARYVKQTKYMYGFVSEEVVGSKVRMHFLSACHRSLGRWLLTWGNNVVIESPEKAKEVLIELVDELSAHHLRQGVRQEAF